MKKTTSNIIAITLGVLFVVAGFSACEEEKTGEWSTTSSVANKPAELTDLDSPPTEKGKIAEIVYVPAYSSIYYQDDGRLCDLTVTLSIHNINFKNPITLTNILYVNTAGHPIRGYVDTPIVLSSMETQQFVIHERDRSGGSGANFLVKWEADSGARSPIIEAVMISTTSQQGISFTTQGTVIRRFATEGHPPARDNSPLPLPKEVERLGK
ncbi:MAG: DUF3124 domain-containing protein [Proteobacteria bacterium]|nr:DUF3124 domain-containing protein [Pseudomonadota bacterium]